MNITNISMFNYCKMQHLQWTLTLHIVMSYVVNIPTRAEKSVGSIPDVLLNLCLGFQIEGISRQKSDPLLLSLGSILLLLQQHFGETLCGNTGTSNRTVINSNTF